MKQLPPLRVADRAVVEPIKAAHHKPSLLAHAQGQRLLRALGLPKVGERAALLARIVPPAILGAGGERDDDDDDDDDYNDDDDDEAGCLLGQIFTTR